MVNGMFSAITNIGNIIIDICKNDKWHDVCVYDNSHNIIFSLNTKYDENYIEELDDKIIIYSTIKGDIIINKQYLKCMKKY